MKEIPAGTDLDSLQSIGTYKVNDDYVNRQIERFNAEIQNGKIYCPICNKIIGFWGGEDGYALCFDCKHSKRILGISSEEIK